MNLTDRQRLDAAHQLQQAGINGTDLETVLRGACELAGDIDYDDWLDHIRTQPLTELVSTYGHDHVRAVWILRNTTPLTR